MREKESKKRYLQNMKKINILKFIQKRTFEENGGIKSEHDQIIEQLLMQEDKYLTGKPILEVKQELAFQALCEELNEKVDADQKKQLSNLITKIELEKSESDDDFCQYLQNVVKRYKAQYVTV